MGEVPKPEIPVRDNTFVKKAPVEEGAGAIHEGIAADQRERLRAASKPAEGRRQTQLPRLTSGQHEAVLRLRGARRSST